MPDPISVPVPWLWGGASAVFAAFVSACVTVFATRKNNEAALLDSVTARLRIELDRQDAAIADLRRQMARERKECDAKLRRMQAEIDRLMGGAVALGVPSYSGEDAVRAQNIGRAAQARQANKGKPDASDS